MLPLPPYITFKMELSSLISVSEALKLHKISGAEFLRSQIMDYPFLRVWEASDHYIWVRTQMTTGISQHGVATWI